MDPALVSIAVPVYNTARFLSAALDSLLAQDYIHWEGLLWDDGSSDGSAEIAAEYARRDPRFRLLGNGGNNGNPRALALALAQARGAFVGVLDGDDLLEPAALSSMLAFMAGQPALGMAYSQYVEIDEDGRELGLGTRFRKPYSPQALLLDFMCHHFRLIRAEAYRAVDGYDGTLDESADYDLCLRLSERVPIAHLAQPLYRYRIRRDSVSGSQRLRQVRSSFDAAQRAVQRRGLDRDHAFSLGLRARHVLRPKPVAGLAAAAFTPVVLRAPKPAMNLPRDVRDLHEALEDCLESRLDGWELVDFATRLVNEKFTRYSVWHLWENSGLAF